MRSRGQEASAGRKLSLAAQVRRARHQEGLSVEQICRLFGIGSFVVRELLSGRELPGRKEGRVDAPHEEGV